jgi:hypothetical protein
MEAMLTKKQRQTLALGDDTSASSIMGLQVRDSDVGMEEEAAVKRKSPEGEQADKGGKKGKSAKALDDCPLHLLEYMIPDDESYVKPSSTMRSGRAPPLSPSVANIKANNTSAVVIPSASKMAPEGTMDTGKKVRKLFNANDPESADALNEAAGCTVAEATPMRRSTRSSNARGMTSTTLLM